MEAQEEYEKAGKKMTSQELMQLQSLPLEIKIEKTKARIREWVYYWGKDKVYISFSGGKDSTVLLDLVRQEFREVEAVFVDTGLEYPEIRNFVKNFDNVTTIRPAMTFKQVIEKYGYPVVSKEVSECVSQAKKGLESGCGYYSYRLEKLKGTALDKNGKKSAYNQEKWAFLLDAPFKVSHQCCNYMKKKPIKEYEKKTNKVAFTGQMAEESMIRKSGYLKNGCNGFEMKRPVSNPLGFWKEGDILEYIELNNLKIADCYGKLITERNLFGEATKRYFTGTQRTG